MDHSQARTGMNSSKRKGILKDLCMAQAWRCFWCGQLMDNSDPKAPRYRTLEHVTAIAGGGSKAKDRSNLRAACSECNQLRGEFHGLRLCNGRLTEEVSRLKVRLTETKEALHTATDRVTELQNVPAPHCYWCRAKGRIKEWFYNISHSNYIWAVRYRHPHPDCLTTHHRHQHLNRYNYK